MYNDVFVEDRSMFDSDSLSEPILTFLKCFTLTVWSKNLVFIPFRIQDPVFKVYVFGIS